MSIMEGEKQKELPKETLAEREEKKCH